MAAATPRPAAGPQVIPRPAHHRPGGPAPWADFDPARRRPVRLAAVVDAVAARDGSADAATTAREVAEFVRTFDRHPDTDPAAVLVALFEEAGEARVLLTVRSSTLRSHRGEVAFPGGRLEPGEIPEQGALREAWEEVGLDPALVTVVGHLTPMPTVSSATLMTPVVATLGGRAATRAAPGEVSRIFDVSLTELLADGAFVEEWWAVPGRRGIGGVPGGEFPVWFFTAGGETIWGATARVLTELLCLTVGLPGAPPGLGR